MIRIRAGGPPGTMRPFVPNIAVGGDADGEKADALDHIARALSAIDHNLEVLTNNAKKQTEAFSAIAVSLSQIARKP